MGNIKLPSSVRVGKRLTTDVNPMAHYVPDADAVLDRGNKAEGAFATTMKILQKGAKPVKGDKVWMNQIYDFDTYDEILSVTLGLSSNSEARLARLRVAQRNVQATVDEMFYQPGDELFLSNGQRVVVVMTPTKKHSKISTLSTALTGNTGTATLAGSIVVMNTERSAIIPFSKGGLHWGGKSVYEGESVSAMPIQHDSYWDCNVVETVETTMEVSEEEKDYFETNYPGGDFAFQKEFQLQRIRKMIDLRLMLSTRSVDKATGSGKLNRVGGLDYFIRTNRMYYNPFSASSFEDLIDSFLLEQGFRVNPNGPNKIFYVGERLHAKWTSSYKDLRRIDMSRGIDLRANGVHFETYTFGNRKIQIVPYENFAVGTPWEWWGMLVDARSLEYCERYGPRIRPYHNNGDRTLKFAMEAAFTMKVRNEPSHAILRTW